MRLNKNDLPKLFNGRYLFILKCVFFLSEILYRVFEKMQCKEQINCTLKTFRNLCVHVCIYVFLKIFFKYILKCFIPCISYYRFYFIVLIYPEKYGKF